MQRSLPKSQLHPDQGAWLEARQGTAVTLVRNECFTSPSGHKKKYANYTIYDGIRNVATPERSLEAFAGGAMFPTAKSGSSPGWVAARISHQLSDSCDGGSFVMPHPRTPVRRPRTSLAMQKSMARVSSSSIPQRPQSSMTYSSLHRDDVGRKRPQTSMGTRTVTTAKHDGIPARTPLRPVTPAGFEEKRRVEQEFFKFVSHGVPDPHVKDSPPSIEKMQSAYAKEPAGISLHKTEKAHAVSGANATEAATNREGRKPRWQEMIDLRRVDRVRTAPGQKDSKVTHASKIMNVNQAEFRRRSKVEYHAPPVIFTEASKRLKHIKGEPSSKTLWVDKNKKHEFAGSASSMSMKMVTKLKKKKNMATAKVNCEQGFIDALLHAAGREEPLNRNAEEWISGFHSLMDKRMTLRQHQHALSQAEKCHQQALVHFKQAENLSKTAAVDTTKAQRVQNATDASNRAIALEIKLMEARRQCELFTISGKEFSSLQHASNNDTGDKAEWHELNENLQEGFFKDQISEKFYRIRAQDALDSKRKGWWQEEFHPHKSCDVRADEVCARQHDDVNEDEKRTSQIDTDDHHAPLSEAALIRRKIEIREEMLKQQQRWAKLDRETPVWERTSDYEERRLLFVSKYRSLYTASGFKWRNAGTTHPTSGRLLTSSGLSDALMNKAEFTQEEWIAFGITELGIDDYIKSADSYFKPAVQTVSCELLLDSNPNCFLRLCVCTIFWFVCLWIFSSVWVCVHDCAGLVGPLSVAGARGSESLARSCRVPTRRAPLTGCAEARRFWPKSPRAFPEKREKNQNRRRLLILFFWPSLVWIVPVLGGVERAPWSLSLSTRRLAPLLHMSIHTSIESFRFSLIMRRLAGSNRSGVSCPILRRSTESGAKDAP